MIHSIATVSRKAARATFVLIPLFGIQLALTIYRLPSHSPAAIHYERFTEVISNSQVQRPFKALIEGLVQSYFNLL